MPQVFCVDPHGREPYKGKIPVKVLVDTLWFDEGYQKADKGEVVKLDVSDAAIYDGSTQVEFLDKKPAA